MEENRWTYDKWPSGEPYEWGGAARNATSADNLDFHIDIGCGLVKKGRIGIDRSPGVGVNVVADLDGAPHHHAPNLYAVAAEPGQDAPDPGEHAKVLSFGLPFEDSSIASAISHHALEHLGRGFVPLLDDVHRCLEPGGVFRIIVPLFPSHSALADPDHKRVFVEGTFEHMLGYEDGGFAVPYLHSKWTIEEKDLSPPTRFDRLFTPEDRREMRITLAAVK